MPISGLSIFDLDRTLVHQNSSYEFCKFLYRKGVFSHSHMVFSLLYRLKACLLNMSLIELHEKVFQRLLFGFSLEELERHVGTFVAKFVPKAIYPPAYAALRHAQHLGHKTVILSNSPHFLVGPISRYFEVDDWRATVYGVDKDKTLCNIENLMEGTNKAQYLVEARKHLKIDKKNVTVYTDSHHDLPLLLEAGIPVVVNPDKKLRKVAKQNNWSVI